MTVNQPGHMQHMPTGTQLPYVKRISTYSTRLTGPVAKMHQSGIDLALISVFYISCNVNIVLICKFLWILII